MKGKKTSVEQAIRIIREVEVLKGQGKSLQEACRKLSYNHRCHPSIINYSYLLLNPNVTPLGTAEYRVFEKTCYGNQSAIANWIDISLEKICQLYEITEYNKIGILVRTENTGNIINYHLQTKHKYYITQSLENILAYGQDYFASYFISDMM